MDSTGLLTQFRSDVVDQELPYLWSDTEVYSYMDDAQRQFCIRVGGIGDVTSTHTQIPVVTTSDIVSISQLILKHRGAYRLSDGRPIEIINYEDMPAKGLRFDGKVGVFAYLIIGMQPGLARLYPYPVAADTLQLVIDRLPMRVLDDADIKLELPDQHYNGLLFRMKQLAYSKQDAETRNDKLALDYEQKFLNYCSEAKLAQERMRHKTRIVAYGGISMTPNTGSILYNRGS